jgi:hypothetical protein
MPRDLRTLACCTLFLVLGCATSGPRQGPEKGSVAWLVQQGRYEDAVRAAADAAAKAPDDARRQADQRRASVALLLARGRDEFLEGRTEAALELFEAAERIEPFEAAVRDWILAARERMADEAYARGLSLHVDADFDAAMAEYEAALEFRPEHGGARAALARALVQKNYRLGMGKGYYDDGIVALDQLFLYEANSYFAYVLKYQPGNERADQRGRHAQAQLAQQRAAVALGLEEAGQYAAARNEFRLALLLDDELELAQLGRERMQREEAVAERIREANRLLLRARFDEADALLAAQLEVTDRQHEEIAAAREEIVAARLETLYRAARTLESDWSYAAAVEAYDRLLEATPFYKDALARRDTLRGFVQDAEALYARYEAAADDAERLALLRQIAIFWPEYRDVRERLAELE